MRLRTANTNKRRALKNATRYGWAELENKIYDLHREMTADRETNLGWMVLEAPGFVEICTKVYADENHDREYLTSRGYYPSGRITHEWS